MNFFKKLGLLGLILFSFFYTYKTTTVIKEQDELMIKIRKEQDKYNINVIESKINDNEIIPGIKGKKVNINKSYDNIKKIGIYSPNYLIYDDIYPKDKLKDNKDKYIVNGPNKKEVSLLFVVNDISNINKILLILNKENIKSDFFITNLFINDNLYLTNEIIKNHSINYYGDYKSSDFMLNNSIIKNTLKQNNIYCYLESKNKDYLDICKINKNYTIIPNIIIKNNMLINIKKDIKNGSLISIYTSNIDELELTINYIKSKGYNIVSLDEIFDI